MGLDRRRRRRSSSTNGPRDGRREGRRRRGASPPKTPPTTTAGPLKEQRHLGLRRGDADKFTQGGRTPTEWQIVN